MQMYALRFYIDCILGVYSLYSDGNLSSAAYNNDHNIRILKHFCIFKKCSILPENVWFQTLLDYTDRVVTVCLSDLNLWIQIGLNVKICERE